MRQLIIISLLAIYSLCCVSCDKTPDIRENPTGKIEKLLDSWHEDVAELREQAYFDKMTEDFVFAGTDPSEVWDKETFRKFCHPYFIKGKTWKFVPVSRNVHLEKNGSYAWFDELLDTWMGVCRGSGVVVYTHGEWKLRHYVLSLTVPNDKMKDVMKTLNEQDGMDAR